MKDAYTKKLKNHIQSSDENKGDVCEKMKKAVAPFNNICFDDKRGLLVVTPIIEES